MWVLNDYYIALLSVIFLKNLLQVQCWDLSGYNVSSDYYVSGIATFGNLGFLTLPRSACSNNASNPTLVEVLWHNEQQNYFFHRRPFFMDHQTWGNCDHLQDAISLDTDPMRARLWILDRGGPSCRAKIVIYNIFQRTNETWDLTDVPAKEDLSSILLDPAAALAGTPRAYLGYAGQDFLVVFALNEGRWWKVKLKVQEFPLELTQVAEGVSTEFLAMSVSTSGIGSKTVLYASGGEERGIFSVELPDLRMEPEGRESTVNAVLLGEKLGSSTGLVPDLKNGLSYFLTRDYAVVRWDMRYPSQAEYYNVLAQSYEALPYVSSLFTGPERGVWALANPRGPKDCSSSEEVPHLKKRAVKLLRYNLF